jgi:hypothetical protein
MKKLPFGAVTGNYKFDDIYYTSSRSIKTNKWEDLPAEIRTWQNGIPEAEKYLGGISPVESWKCL